MGRTAGARLLALAIVIAAAVIGGRAVERTERLFAAVRDAGPGRLPELGPEIPGGAPVLVLVADPHCPSCADALAEWPPPVEALGVRSVTMPPPRGEPFVLPSWLLYDQTGARIGALRGHHSPEVLRAWVEVTLAGAPR